MDSNNKTLKQLLTEPYRVQKKNGYYSYETFRQTLLKQFISLGKEKKKDFLGTSVVAILDSLQAKIKELARIGEIDKANTFTPAGSIINFLAYKNKKILYLDHSLFSLFMETKLPLSVNIKSLFCPGFLLLMPSHNCIGLTAILLYELESDIAGVPIANCEEYGTTAFVTVEKEENIEVGIDMTKYEELIFNFLLWQQSMHDKGEEVIELDAPTRKMGFSKNSKQIIVPKVIGEGYKPKVIRNYESQGTHASPRTHWRSGHWRQQMIGSRKNPEYKTIWIEPTLINA